MSTQVRELVRRSVGRDKDPSVETLRGLAVLLMVAGHVVGAQPEVSMQVPDDSAWRPVFSALQDVRMPLFTALSGYLYAVRPPVTPAGFRPLAIGKVRRLLVPLLTIGAVFYAARSFLPGVNSGPSKSLWASYLFSFDYLWFLQAIFLIFLVVGALDMTGALGTRRRWAAVTLSAAAVYVLVSVPEEYAVFSLDRGIRLLPFFLLGLGLRRFGLLSPARWQVALAAGVLAVTYLARLLPMEGSGTPQGPQEKALAALVGVSALCLLFWFRGYLSKRPLAWIGAFAFTIYLLHFFAVAASRIFLRAVGLDVDGLVFVAGLTAGIGLPILFHLCFGWVRVAVLGERPLREVGSSTGRPAGQRPTPAPSATPAA